MLADSKQAKELFPNQALAFFFCGAANLQMKKYKEVRKDYLSGMSRELIMKKHSLRPYEYVKLINKIVLKLINEYSLSCTLINQKKIVIEKLELYKKLSDIYKSRNLAGVGDLFSYNNSLVIIDNVLLELSEIELFTAFLSIIN